MILVPWGKENKPKKRVRFDSADEMINAPFSSLIVGIFEFCARIICGMGFPGVIIWII